VIWAVPIVLLSLSWVSARFQEFKKREVIEFDNNILQAFIVLKIHDTGFTFLAFP